MRTKEVGMDFAKLIQTLELYLEAPQRVLHTTTGVELQWCIRARGQPEGDHDLRSHLARLAAEHYYYVEPGHVEPGPGGVGI